MTSTPPLASVFQQPARFPDLHPVLGVLPKLQDNPLAVMTRATLELGPVSALPAPGLKLMVVASPRLVEHVLVGNAANFRKQTRGYDMLRLVLGNGLVTSEGDFWKRQRRLAQPAFHRQKLAQFGEAMVRCAQEMVDGWTLGEPFELTHELMRCTLRVVSQTLLGTDVAGSADAVGAAMTELLEQLIDKTLHPLSLPTWVPTPANWRFQRALDSLDRVVREVIAQRRATPRSDDLLGMLMDAQDPETGERMSDDQLRDEVMTIMLAGHETTANALAWTFVLLGQAPQVEARVVSELTSVESLGMAALPQLRVGANVIKESLRLYPPVWSLGRRVVADDVVEGWLLPKNAILFICPYALHRLPEAWRDPLAFDPDRWNEPDAGKVRGASLPFSLGQRKCIGDGFALAEAQLILSAVLQRVRLSLVPGQHFEPEPLITLRPKEGVRVVARAR